MTTAESQPKPLRDNRHVLFLNLYWILGSKRDPVGREAAYEQLRRVLALRPNVKCVWMGDGRKQDLPLSLEYLREEGYPEWLIERIEDVTPLPTLHIGERLIRHMIAYGVEVELYLEQNRKEILCGYLRSCTILSAHAGLFLNYMIPQVVQSDNNSGLSKEEADMVLSMLPEPDAPKANIPA